MRDELSSHLIAYMIEGHLIAWALAIVLILGLVSRFPTLGRIKGWIESPRDFLLKDRQAVF